MSRKGKASPPFIPQRSQEQSGQPVARTVAIGEHQVHGDLAVLLHMAQTSTEEIRMEIMRMADAEQKYRHEVISQGEQHEYELRQENMKFNYKLKENQQRNIFWTDMVGKISGSIFFLGISFVACLLIWNNNMSGLVGLGVFGAVLIVFIKCFTWLMGTNHSAPEKDKK